MAMKEFDCNTERQDENSTLFVVALVFLGVVKANFLSKLDSDTGKKGINLNHSSLSRLKCPVRPSNPFNSSA